MLYVVVVVIVVVVVVVVVVVDVVVVTVVVVVVVTIVVVDATVVVVVVVVVDVPVFVFADCLFIRSLDISQLDFVTFLVAETISKLDLPSSWKICFLRPLPFDEDLFFLFTGQIPFDLSVPHSDMWVPEFDLILLEPSAK